MKIIWNENPLRTVIELDEWEKKELWYKTYLDILEHHLFDIHFHLDETKKYYDLERVKKFTDPDYFLSEKDKKCKLEERTDRWYKDHLEALTDSHCGDCTCVASSCFKCHAEDLLGINTIKDLHKHEAAKVGAAFGSSRETNWEDTRSIDEVIEYLKNYTVSKKDHKKWGEHAVRWEREAKNAYKWLKNYKNEHFKNVDPHEESGDN